MPTNANPAAGKASALNNQALLREAITDKNVKKKTILDNVYLLLVFSSGLIFLVLIVAFTFLIVIPRLSSISAKRQLIAQQNQQYKRLVEKRDKLATLDRSTLDTNLSTVNRSIPSDLDLSELASLVNSIATKHNLQVRTLTLDQSEGDNAGELKFSVNDVQVTTIVGPFSFIGAKNDIAQFLRDWYNSQYALRFSEIRLAQQGTDVWQLDLRILGYSMPLVKDTKPELALPTIDQQLLDQLNNTGQ